MKSKNSIKPTYSFTTIQEGKDHFYQVVQLFPSYALLEGGYVRSRRDAADSARAAIRQLEAGTHPTQRRCDWQDCIPAEPDWIPQPMVSADFSYLPF